MRLGDVLLDRPTLDDIAAVHAIYSDPQVWTHLPSGRNNTVGTTEDMVRGWIRGWECDGLSSWIVRDARSGEVLGNAGCSVRRGVFWNLGYRLDHKAHGRGIATAVAVQAVERAHETRPDVPVVAYLLEHNLASARVAQKTGLTLRHRGPDAGNPNPDAIRLIYADRPLTSEELRAVLA